MTEEVDPVVQVDEDDLIVLFVNHFGQHFLAVVFGSLLGAGATRRACTHVSVRGCPIARGSKCGALGNGANSRPNGSSLEGSDHFNDAHFIAVPPASLRAALVVLAG